MNQTTEYQVLVKEIGLKFVAVAENPKAAVSKVSEFVSASHPGWAWWHYAVGGIVFKLVNYVPMRIDPEE